MDLRREVRYMGCESLRGDGVVGIEGSIEEGFLDAMPPKPRPGPPKPIPEPKPLPETTPEPPSQYSEIA